MVPSALQAVGSLGVLSRGSNTNAFEGDNKAFLELNMLYGDPRIGRSRTPYDDFTVLLRFGGGGGFSEAKVRGRLLGQPFHNDRIQFNVTQAYDFAKNNVYQFGAQAFNGNVAVTFGSLSDGLSFWVNGWGGLTALGAVDSIPLEGVDACAPAPPDGDGAGQGVSEGPRCYDYGPGSDFGARAILANDGRPIVDFLYETHHLYSLDGVRANHFLQQLRLDLLVPLKGPLGVGFAGEYFDRRTYFSQHRQPDTEVPLSPGALVYDMEVLMSLRGLAAGLVALACLTPVPAGAQSAPSASATRGRRRPRPISPDVDCRRRHDDDDCEAIVRKAVPRTAPEPTCTPGACSGSRGVRVNPQVGCRARSVVGPGLDPSGR